MQYVLRNMLDRAIGARPRAPPPPPQRARARLRLVAGDPKLEVEVADVEGEAETTEVMDYQRGEDQQQDRHENPKQPPQQGRHSASEAHGRQLPAIDRSMRAIKAFP